MTECPRCRMVMEGRAKFCESCGYQFAIDPQADETPGNRSNRSPMWIVLCLVAGVIITIIAMSGGGENSSVQSSTSTGVAASVGPGTGGLGTQSSSELRVGTAVVKVGDLADDVFPVVKAYKVEAPQTRPDPTNPGSLAVTHSYAINGTVYRLEFRRREDPGPYSLFAIYWDSGSAPPKRSASAEQPSSSSAVQGLSANWFLAQQSEKHRKTVEALTDAKNHGDTRAFIQILRLRSIELAKAISSVKDGSYSITDKQKILNVLEQEKAWADSSAEALSQD